VLIENALSSATSSSIKVLCDFDGTISLEDVTDGLLSRFADASWTEVEAEWLAGRIGSRECMAKQVSLIDATREELDSYLDTVEIDPYFASFVDECERRNYVSLEISSDGIAYAVRRVLENHGLSRLRVRANALVAVSGTTYRLRFPYSVSDCNAQAGNCKCSAARGMAAAAPHPSAVVLIGDGASDFCAASQVDFVFAKARLLKHCVSMKIPHIAFDSFIEVKRELARVLDDFLPERLLRRH